MQKIIKPFSILSKYPEHNIYIADDIFTNFNQIIQKYPNALIVTDENIHKKLLTNFTKLNSKILAANVKAEKGLAEKISNEILAYDFAIAIGSGTINDLVKYAAYLANRPYIIFATAPSMNGYYSENASLISNNLKQSYKAKIALDGYFDLKILAHAPLRLIQSGIGDSICSTTARADWLLSHYITGSTYEELPFDLTYKLEEKLYQKVNLLKTRKLEPIYLLTEILIYSGLAMTYCNGSYPASQGEHLIAHLYEMLDPDNANLLYHGEQIALTSLIMISLQEKLIKQTNIMLKTRSFPTMIKNLNIVKAPLDIASTNQILATKWPELTNKILAKFRSNITMIKILNEAGINIAKNQNILNQNLYEFAIKNAFLIRDRFTFLDLNHYL